MVNKARRKCVYPVCTLPLRADIRRTRQTTIRALLFILFVALPILGVVYWILDSLPLSP